ncbi:MAG: PTS sugar transporter subunit IIA [Treponema sp.]|nr:PTS sugar transporter subunit IIA [Treponema sp.]
MKFHLECRLAALVRRGGVHRGIVARDLGEALRETISLLPKGLGADRERLLSGVLEREALLSTGIGRGIAMPHPRKLVLGEGEAPFVAVSFLAEPVDWDSIDGESVSSIFLVVSSSTLQHLCALSRINFICRNDEFRALIERRAPDEELFAAIERSQEAWDPMP